MTRKLLQLAVATLTLATLSKVCGASTLYGIEFATGTGFYTVDQTTGGITLLGNTGNTATGDLTSNLQNTIWTVDMTNADLLTVNRNTGALGPAIPILAPTGGPVDIVSLAWNPVTGVLFGNTSVGFGNTTNDQLFTINPTTGAATFVGTIGFNAVYALGFSRNGTLYGISNTSSDLITINTATGVGSLVAPVTLTAAYDLAFRPEDDVMFVADSGTSSLYTMDRTTGAAALVGGYGSSTNVVGLAFIVPEPSTALLFLGGLALAGIGARKRLSR